MAPIAVTILLTEATRTGSSMVTRRWVCGSAMPSAKLATSAVRVKAIPTSAFTAGESGGTVAQAASARLGMIGSKRIGATYRATPDKATGSGLSYLFSRLRESRHAHLTRRDR